jgi:hypothetical protein
MASMRHSMAIRSGCARRVRAAIHEVYLEEGLTLDAFLQFLDTLPIKRPS